MISKETEAEIARLYHGEKWPIGTIAGQLGLHHTTVSARAPTDWGRPQGRRAAAVDRGPVRPVHGRAAREVPKGFVRADCSS
jgi:hypothetical protein